jgi:hypothetical protein
LAAKLQISLQITAQLADNDVFNLAFCVFVQQVGAVTIGGIALVLNA